MGSCSGDLEGSFVCTPVALGESRTQPGWHQLWYLISKYGDALGSLHCCHLPQRHWSDTPIFIGPCSQIPQHPALQRPISGGDNSWKGVERWAGGHRESDNTRFLLAALGANTSAQHPQFPSSALPRRDTAWGPAGCGGVCTGADTGGLQVGFSSNLSPGHRAGHWLEILSVALFPPNLVPKHLEVPQPCRV